MATKRIYELQNEANPADSVNIIIDKTGWAAPRQTTKAQLLSAEVIARTNTDNAIIAGAGLESNGSMTPLPASAFLKNADFVSAGLPVNLKNAEALLDSAISGLSNSIVRKLIVTITSAEILACGTAIVKVPVPIINTFYNVKNIIYKVNFNTHAYACGAGGIYIRYTSAGVGEYIARIYDEVKNRPRYVVSKTIDFMPVPEDDNFVRKA